MNKIKFDSTLVADVQNGKKIATFRYGNDKQYHVGEIVELVNSKTSDVFATAEIEQITEKRIKNLNAYDYEGHETYDSQEELINVMNDYYDGVITPESPIKIVKFKLIPQQNKLEKNTTLFDNVTEVKLYTDGGSRGNPGPSAAGWTILTMDDDVLKSDGKYLGVTTNNQAEYQAVLLGLQDCFSMGARQVYIYMDSLLVVNQMTGIFKIKNRDLWPINQAIKEKIQQFEKVTFTHVPRELNKLADAEVNKVLDAEMS
jgi:ribonuclease HI/uncharacterized protein YqfB (UPF0267 family)